MQHTFIELTEGTFAATYPLRTNHLKPNASWTYGEGPGCLFETYGQELAFVREQDPRTVWTLIEQDGDQYVESGFHLVNRIGFLISTVPVPEGMTVRVALESTPTEMRDLSVNAARCDEVIAGYGQSGMQENLIDLLADAMHWSGECFLDFHVLLMKAGRQYLEELQDPSQPRRR